MLFLDGANDLYLTIFELLTPCLSPTALIAADMSFGDRDHDRCRAYVNDPDGGLIATDLMARRGLAVATPRSADQYVPQHVQESRSRHFRNVAGSEASRRLLLSLLVWAKRKSGSRTLATSRRPLTREVAEVFGCWGSADHVGGLHPGRWFGSAPDCDRLDLDLELGPGESRDFDEAVSRIRRGEVLAS